MFSLSHVRVDLVFLRLKAELPGTVDLDGVKHIGCFGRLSGTCLISFGKRNIITDVVAALQLEGEELAVVVKHGEHAEPAAEAVSGLLAEGLHLLRRVVVLIEVSEHLINLPGLELLHGIVAELEHRRGVLVVERAAELFHTLLARLLVLVRARRAGGEETKGQQRASKKNVFLHDRIYLIRKEGVPAL